MAKSKISILDLHLRYKDGKYPLRGVNLEVIENKINVVFGPAGGGKSSLIRVLNRLTDLSDVEELSGEVLLDGVNILAPDVDVIALRRRVGVVFSRPIPLPLTIAQNISFGLEVAGMKDKKQIAERVEKALREAVLRSEEHTPELQSRQVISYAVFGLKKNKK